MNKTIYAAFFLLYISGAGLFSQETTKTFSKNGREIKITKYGVSSEPSKKSKISEKKSSLNFGSAYSMSATLSVSVSSTNISCNSYNDGSAQANVTGGTPPYQFLWLPTNDTVSAISNLSAGSYTVIVLDSLCSIDTAVFNIAEPLPVLNTSGSVSTSCNSCDGIAYIVPEGSGPFSILWSNSDTNDSLTNLCGGSYTGTITETSSGCSQNFNVFVASYKDSLSFVFDGTCASSPIFFNPIYIYPFSAFVDYTSCYSPTTWYWDFGDTLSANNVDSVANPSHLFTASGLYNVMLVVNGTDTVRKIVNIPASEVIFDGFTDCSNPPGVLFFDQSPCASAWLWNFGDPSSGAGNIDSVSMTQHVFSSVGSYNVTLIINPGTPGADTLVKPYNFTAFPPVNLGNDTVMLHGDTITLDAGIAQMYLWSNGEMTQSIEVTSPGLYSVSKFDSLGCGSYDEKLVLVCGYHLIAGTPSYERDIKVSVYPSPARDNVMLECSKISGRESFSVFDISGREMKSVKVTDVRSSFDCSSFASGLYFYRLTDGKKLISSGKFVKE